METFLHRTGRVFASSFEGGETESSEKLNHAFTHRMVNELPVPDTKSEAKTSKVRLADWRIHNTAMFTLQTSSPFFEFSPFLRLLLQTSYRWQTKQLQRELTVEWNGRVKSTDRPYKRYGPKSQ